MSRKLRARSGRPQKKTVILPLFLLSIVLKNLFQSGLPLCHVRPVLDSLLSLISNGMLVFLWRTLPWVICIWMSRNRSVSCHSSCCFSNSDNKLTNHSKLLWSLLIHIKSTFLNFITLGGMGSDHSWAQEGQMRLASIYFNIIDCKMLANGVTPIPVAINIACCVRNMWEEGDP